MHDYSVTDGAVDNGDGTYTIDTTDDAAGDPYGSIVRAVDGTTVADYDSHLSAAWERTANCGGGSPRINLYFDDGTYLTTDGPGSPGYSGCDLTDSFDATATTDGVWRLHPGPSTFVTWTEVLATYGERVVTASSLADDSFWNVNYQSVSTYSDVILGPPGSHQGCLQEGRLDGPRIQEPGSVRQSLRTQLVATKHRDRPPLRRPVVGDFA